jgi:hypothetical protein
MGKCVLQEWVLELPFMQQSVLISSIRGADGAYKEHPSKPLMRWLRRCVLISAFDNKALDNPYHAGGGSYTGPSFDWHDQAFEIFKIDNPNLDWERAMDKRVKEFMSSQDTLPIHFYLHVIHAASIIGYKHSNLRIRAWWNKTYNRHVHDMHLHGETQEELDKRLNDDEKAWRADETRFKK